jgi:RHS repeat-associated protein
MYHSRELSLNQNKLECYAQDRCVAEYTSDDDCGTLAYSAGYIYADSDGLGAPVAVEDSAGSYQYIATDPQGNVIYQAHSSSYIVLVKYDAYGNVYNTSAGDLDLPFRFAGMRYEKDADIYLTPNRAYSPALGRWLQVDPLGTLPNAKTGNRLAPLDQYTDGQNLYEYCSGDPVNQRDLWGLELDGNLMIKCTEGCDKYLGNFNLPVARNACYVCCLGASATNNVEAEEAGLLCGKSLADAWKPQPKSKLGWWCRLIKWFKDVMTL